MLSSTRLGFSLLALQLVLPSILRSHYLVSAGTSCGSIHLIGTVVVSLVLSVYSNPPRPASEGKNPVKFLCFHPGFSRLIAIGELSNKFSVSSKCSS